MKRQKQYKQRINYRGLFTGNAEEVLTGMKDSRFYESGTDGEGVLMKEIVEQLNVEIKGIKEMPTPSPFMFLYLAEKNGKNFSNKSYGFEGAMNLGFFKSKSKMKSLLPNTFNRLKSSMEIFENSQIKSHSPNNKRNITLLGNKVKNNSENIIREIEKIYFENPDKFFELNGIEKKFIISSYFDLTQIKNDLELYNIRFGIINNLQKVGGPNSFLDVISYKVNNRRNREDTFYLPVNVKGTSNNHKIKILDVEFDVGVDSIKDPENPIEFLVIEGPDLFSKVREHLIATYFLDTSVNLNKRENILVYLPGGSDGAEVNHDNRKKTKGRDSDQNLNDYTWITATQTVKDLSSDIIPLITNKHDKPDVSSFVLSCLDSIYSFSGSISKEDIFLKSGFVLERIASSITRPKGVNEKKVITYNDRIKTALNSIISISGDNVNKIIIEEMLVYRNALIHGGNPSGIRVGAYGAILNIVISYIIQYLTHNIDLLDHLSIMEVLETMFYRENIV